MKTNHKFQKIIQALGITILLSWCVAKAEAQTSPYSMTMPPWLLSPTSELLRGAASANDISATTWFEWGTNFTMSITSAPVVITNFDFNLVSNVVTGLSPGITYSFRLVVSNSAGISYGAEQRFTTGMRMLEWGNNHYYYTDGLTNIPPGLTNMVGCAAGDFHFVGLRNDHTVATWGVTGGYCCPVAPPANATNVVAVCARTDHSLALRSDGTVVPWGDSTDSMNFVPVKDTNIVAIGCGTQHNVVVRSDGSADSWGYAVGPIPSAASNCVAVAGGGHHNLALRLDGTVIAWGYNNYGQTNVPDRATNILAIAAGGLHSLALRNDGTVVAWGDNTMGQTNVPPDATNIIAIAAGELSGCGLKKDGTLVYWGQTNSNGVAQGAIPGVTVTAVELGAANTIVLGPDIPPSATQNIATTYPNAGVQIQLLGSDPNGDPFTLNVSSLPAHGALFQANNGARGPQIVTVPTAPTDIHGWIFYSATNSIGTDSFTVTVTNDQYTSAPATYTLNIILPGAPQFLVPQVTSFSNNQFGLQFNGTFTASYNVWSSTNLQDWVLLGPATDQPNNIFHFWDPDISAPQKFYRATSP